MSFGGLRRSIYKYRDGLYLLCGSIHRTRSGFLYYFQARFCGCRGPGDDGFDISDPVRYPFGVRGTYLFYRAFDRNQTRRSVVGQGEKPSSFKMQRRRALEQIQTDIVPECDNRHIVLADILSDIAVFRQIIGCCSENSEIGETASDINFYE